MLRRRDTAAAVKWGVPAQWGAWTGWVALLVVTGCTAEDGAPAPDAESLTAEVIAARTTEAMGLEGVQTLRVEAQYPDHDYLVVSEVRRPDHYFSTNETGFLMAFDGTRAWYREGADEAGVLPDIVEVSEDQLKDFELDIAFLVPAYVDHPAEYVETRTENGISVHVLDMTLPKGARLSYWVDAETYFPVRAQATVTVEGAEYTFYRTYADFQESGGVTFPRRFTYPGRDGVTEIDGSFVSVEPNVDIPDERFVPPGEGG